MKQALLLAEFLSMPWAIMPERMSIVAQIVARWSAGNKLSSEQITEAIGAAPEMRAARKDAANRAGNGTIAVLPLYGVVTQRGNMMDDLSGGGSVSTQRFTQSFRDALADDTVGGILIDIDSPGGSVYGVQELADEIYQARGKKPIMGIANSLCASAAYWIGSSVDQLFVTPSGEVGSIGVICSHDDYSKAMEDAGIKTTFITAGKFKAEGNSTEPLSDEARAFIQTRADDYYQVFTKTIARNRGVGVATVRDGMGQGRCLGAAAALEQGMVDGIATFDEAVKLLSKQMRGSKTSNSRAAISRRELEILSA